MYIYLCVVGRLWSSITPLERNPLQVYRGLGLLITYYFGDSCKQSSMTRHNLISRTAINLLVYSCLTVVYHLSECVVCKSLYPKRGNQPHYTSHRHTSRTVATCEKYYKYQRPAQEFQRSTTAMLISSYSLFCLETSSVLVVCLKLSYTQLLQWFIVSLDTSHCNTKTQPIILNHGL